MSQKPPVSTSQKTTSHPHSNYRLDISSFRNPKQFSGGRQDKIRHEVRHRQVDKHDDEISINIHLPHLSIPRLRIPWKKVLGWGSVVAVLLAAVISTPSVLDGFSSSNNQTSEQTLSNAPVYSPLTPETVTNGQVSGAQYDNKKQLYKYNDEYKGVSLTISQQPIPDQLRDDPAKIADIAKTSINATEIIRTTNGDAYIVTDEKTNTQRVVLVHRQLLVFIQSYDRLENVDWLVYIQNLQ